MGGSLPEMAPWPQPPQSELFAPATASPCSGPSLRSLQPEVCAGPVPAFSFSASAGPEEQNGQGRRTGSLGEGRGEGAHSWSPPQPHFSSFTWFPASNGGWEERGPVNEMGMWSL